MSLKKRVALLVAIYGIGLGAWSIYAQNPAGQNSQSQADGGRQMSVVGVLWGSIERAASAAKADDASSMRGLVDAVFNYPYSYRLNPNLEALAKGRLLQAEVAFRQGRGPGVQEQSLVDTINTVADRFGAPDYAKTSAAQVRHFRMTLAVYAPKFMGAGMSRPGAKIGESINDTMSPLQAAHLMAVLVEQKLSNPTYQVPPDQWKSPGLPPGAQVSQSQPGRLSVDSNPKRLEMEHVISAGAANLSSQDGQQLVNDVFSHLGIR